MIEQNKKIITAHLDGKEEEKLDALKELLNTSEDELFNSSDFNFSNAGLKYHNDIGIQDVNSGVKFSSFLCCL